MNIEHIGDGVYAEHDGFYVLLRVNNHQNEPVVYLEPFVMKNLIEFYERKKKEANTIERESK